DAGSLTDRNGELPPLPRHLLQQAFEGASTDAVINHSYWNREFVGIGPYKLDRWEPGAFIEASAFDKHALGKANIGRIKIAFIADGQTVVANLLTGEVQLGAIDAVRLDQALTLRREWQPKGGGDFTAHPNQWRAVFFQMRPDLANPKAILNPTVRKALAHA